MARKARPWFRAGRGWCVVVSGRIVPLGVRDEADETGAWAAWDRLRKGLPGAKLAAGTTVAAAVPRFLEESAGRVAGRTAKNYGHYLSRFLATFGGEFIAGLDAAGVEEWASLQPWSDTNRANYLWTVGAFLKWAGSPVRLKKPPKESRGAEAVIPEDVYRKCLRESYGDFHQVIRFLWHTGARPGEAARVTAESVDRQAGAVLVRQHKTRRHGKTRTIFLDAEAAAVCREQAERYGSGYLFRGMRGKPFSLQAYTMRFQRLSDKVGATVTSYMFRHTFATRMLAAGESAAIVAALLGHATTAMLDRHYSHVGDQAKVLRAALDRAGGRPAA